MRYSEEHKQQTHEKLIATASQRFREQGYDGVSIGALMSELDLTHGGFYRHFSDKERLYLAAISYSIQQVKQNISEQAGEGDKLSLRDVITAYLSLDHCDDVGSGCPVAALSSEIAHQSDAVQNTFEQGIQSYMQEFLPLISGKSDEERKQKFYVLFSGMVGALSVARSITDKEMKAQILDSARQFYLTTYCE